MYGNYYKVYPIILKHIASNVAADNTVQFYEQTVLGKDSSQMFDKMPNFARIW
jgi:hypothetical protein